MTSKSPHGIWTFSVFGPSSAAEPIQRHLVNSISFLVILPTMLQPGSLQRQVLQSLLLLLRLVQYPVAVLLMRAYQKLRLRLLPCRMRELLY